MKERVNEFLRDLTDLSERYGLYINGCGCCGSPWIYDENGKILVENLSYDKKKGYYEYQ